MEDQMELFVKEEGEVKQQLQHANSKIAAMDKDMRRIDADVVSTALDNKVREIHFFNKQHRYKHRQPQI